MIRAQYHIRRVGDHLHIWDLRKLAALAADCPVTEHPLARIAEIDEAYWFDATGDQPTCRAVMAHAGQAAQTDLGYPILLCASGRVMDGMHRVMKAVAEGRDTIAARQLRETPPPDYIDRSLDDLPYD
ncbi:hypothetical protein [Flavimaricola marinus]|uniref:ParB-like nuclease domain protein n=1 Tax=Flavimaricola marinus TaxID=1819565 RepID=A0A238LA00_9RHOB|nr:hypothetical protein [Flavimaricola marinus]SMY06509.1 hypothetical protein LOM8899_00634 [Flavimaricola marinus]